MGKTSGGDYKAYSSNVSSDVKEYIKNNTGKNAPKDSSGSAYIPNQLVGIASNMSTQELIRSDSYSNNTSATIADSSSETVTELRGLNDTIEQFTAAISKLIKD